MDTPDMVQAKQQVAERFAGHTIDHNGYLCTKSEALHSDSQDRFRTERDRVIHDREK